MVEPIAIVGRACLLPGAPDPAALARAVLGGADLLRDVPPGRWRTDPARLRAAPPEQDDRTWSLRGGYVDDFTLDPTGLAVPPGRLRGLDPVFAWSLHVLRAALHDAGRERGGPGVGAVLGNLSFPTLGMATWAASVWLGPDAAAAGLPPVDARDRFMSGLPARLAAEALDLRAGAFCLDAACASGLYALALACDALRAGRADLMLAAAVNAADDLFIHMGFTALGALSPSGRSRPFHRDADGLVPAEGAAAVALRRLSDAERSGDRILGVIRGVGLANDGRGRGLLAPCADGQVLALRRAYAQAGVRPTDIGLLECHATGTTVGDATELRSAAEVFAGHPGLPIGSLKGNLGHTITVAGLAGLLKLLACFEAGVRAPTLHADIPAPALRGAPLRLLTAAEPWPDDEPRRAAVSAFGFGGNNAHVIVEQWRPAARPRTAPAPAPPPDPIAIVGVGLRIGGCDAPDRLAALLLDPASPAPPARMDTVALARADLRFPPADLRHALGQQTAVLAAALDAMADRTGPALPGERAGVIVGMGCDPEVARAGARWRSAAWAEAAARTGMTLDPAWPARAADGFLPPLRAPAVLGVMPNLVANRLSSQFDLRGPGFTVSAEEASGLVAVAEAARLLRTGALDMVLAAAVDLSCEPVHQAARAALGDASLPADAAVVVVLRRLADARRDGERVYALLPDDPGPVERPADPGASSTPGRTNTECQADPAPPLLESPSSTPGRTNTGCQADPAPRLEPVPAAATRLGDDLGVERRLGRSHAAAGLLRLVAAALCLQRGALPGPRGARPWLSEGPRRAVVEVDVLGGPPAALALAEAPDVAPLPVAPPAPLLAMFAAPDLAGLRDSLLAGRQGREGAVRLVVLARDAGALAARCREALAALPSALPRAPVTALAPGVHLGHGRPGELAFVYPGAAAAYAGMGRAVALAFPGERDALWRAVPGLQDMAEWSFAATDRPATPMHQLWGCSFLCQLHARVLRDHLGLRPDAAIGYSSGETNALFAHGAWTDIARMLAQTRDEPLFRSELCGPFAAAQRAWRRAGLPEGPWENWCVAAPLAQVRAALADEAQAHLVIVNTANDCVIGGHADACRRVLTRLPGGAARPLGYAIVAHAPELAEAGDAWRSLHRRPTCPISQPRLYSAATASAHAPTEASAEEALYGQAIRTLDLPAVIDRAYDDGVRIFLELGPRGLTRGWIREILGDRPHVAIALDQPGRDGLDLLWDAAAQLAAAAVAVDLDALRRALTPAPARARPQDALELPAHMPPVVVPPLAVPKTMSSPPPPALRLPPAPPLPAVRTLRDPPLAGPTDDAAPWHEPRPVLAEPDDPRPAAAAAGLRAVTATHLEFLALQSEAQRRFLAIAARVPLATRGLSREPHAAGAPASALAEPPPRAPDLSRESHAPAPPPRAPDLSREPHAPDAPASALAEPPPRAPDPSPAAAVLPVASEPASPARPGPKFTREDLEALSRGPVSRHFGPRFAAQDRYTRQVRMPMPPLLLADRVTGIDGEPGSLGCGTIWTETDVRPDAWYLHDGLMPAGLVVEAGQADLLLLSWLGADFENRGERVYRLLGCDLTYFGVPIRAGDTVHYEIHVDGYALQGGVRLAFFRSECRVRGELRMRVSHGRAGFFTDAELASSAGVLWDPASATPARDARLDAPPVQCTRGAFTREQIAAFAAGDAATCFGPGFERSRTHTRPPRISTGDMQLIHEVPAFDPTGGPWKRGYMRATYTLTPDTWFFPCHFAGDPCMPGTLMCEGLMQAMAIYLAGLGHTLPRDGWRFEAVPELSYQLRCRGQVTPASRELVYEVFVEEHHAGPFPTLHADILCTVDGLRAFHCRRMGLRLVPDWPLSSLPALPPAPASVPVAEHDGVRFDHAALLACAWGAPTAAFGPRFAAFDGPRRLARLPGPPYHFMTRVVALDAARLGSPAGASVEVDYDVPRDAWYFDHDRPVLPFAVLLEVALQPCGWLAMAHGTAVRSAVDLHFRNLDGQAVLHADVGPDAGTIRTRVAHLGTADSGGITLVRFAVTCDVGDRRVLELRTSFGFFPSAALANQVGLPVLPEHRRWLAEPCERVVDLSHTPGTGPLRLPGGMLRMLDRVSGWWPEAGAAGLGRARAELDIGAAQWFFKAHFFQDPVMPGSLGLQAMLQLLQWTMLERGLGDDLEAPRFEALQTGAPIVWSYRGQIVPETARMTIDLELLELGRDDRGPLAVAAASLWADETRIYQVSRLGLRIVQPARTPAVGEAPPPVVRADGRVDLERLRRFWSARTGVADWLIEDLILAMIRHFVGRIHLPATPLPRGALLLANHETAVESLLLCPIYGALTGEHAVALSKIEHRESWIGGLMTAAQAYPGATVPSLLAYFDRSDRASLPDLLDRLAADVLRRGQSLLIHVEGTRARSCRHRPERLGGAVLDLAVRHRLPIVPVRFTGGLPVAPAPTRLDFPIGHGAQDIHFGATITPEQLAGRPRARRAALVLAAIADLGPAIERTEPCAPEPALVADVARLARETGLDEVAATLLAILRRWPDPSPETRALLGARDSQLPPDRRRWLTAVREALALPRGDSAG